MAPYGYKLQQSSAPRESEITAGNPKHNDVCLHNQLDLERLHDFDERLKGALTEGLSVSSTMKYNCLHTLLRAKNFDTAANEIGAPSDALIPPEGFRALFKPCLDNLFVNLTKGMTPLQTTIQIYSVSTVDYAHLTRIIEELLKRLPKSIYIAAGSEAEKNKDKTAYQLLNAVSVNDENRTGIEDAEEILKKACIGLRPIESDLEKKLKFLY